MAPRPLLQNWSSCWHPTIAHYNGNGTTSTPPKLAVTFPPTIAHYNGTLQWHPAMAPRLLPQSSPPTIAHYNGTTSTPPKLVVALPSLHHTTLPMAPRNGTTSTPPKLVVKPPSTHTMAMWNGTQQWHHVHCTLQWHPGATSNQPKWFVALPPLLEVRTPIAIAIWGKTHFPVFPI